MKQPANTLLNTATIKYRIYDIITYPLNNHYNHKRITTTITTKKKKKKKNPQYCKYLEEFKNFFYFFLIFFLNFLSCCFCCQKYYISVIFQFAAIQTTKKAKYMCVTSVASYFFLNFLFLGKKNLVFYKSTKTCKGNTGAQCPLLMQNVLGKLCSCSWKPINH